MKINLHQLKVKTTTPETPQSKIYNKPGKEEVCVQVLFALVWLVHVWLVEAGPGTARTSRPAAGQPLLPGTSSGEQPPAAQPNTANVCFAAAILS